MGSAIAILALTVIGAILAAVGVGLILGETLREKIHRSGYSLPTGKSLAAFVFVSFDSMNLYHS